MNRYPLWKYIVIVVALFIGAIYTIPNFFGEAPAVQISAGKATVKIDLATQERVTQLLTQANIENKGIQFERAGNNGTIKSATILIILINGFTAGDRKSVV